MLAREGLTIVALDCSRGDVVGEEEGPTAAEHKLLASSQEVRGGDGVAGELHVQEVFVSLVIHAEELHVSVETGSDEHLRLGVEVQA